MEDECEKVILVSGDADFTNVIKKLREVQKKIELWSFTESDGSCPLSPFLYKELMKNNESQGISSIKSLNAMFKC